MFYLLTRKRLSLSGILGEPFAPEDAPRVYSALQDRTPGLLTAVFRWL